MDTSFAGSRARIEFWLSSRIQSLSKSVDPKVGLSQKRRLRGGVLLLMGLIFGVAAYRSTQEETWKAWEKSHFPSSKVLTAAWLVYGFKELKESSLLQKVMRSLPISTDDSARLWFTENLEWIAIFEAQYEGAGLKVFCRSCSFKGKEAPKDWSPARLGWSGFEQLLENLERRSSQQRVDTDGQKARKTLPRDPREIVY